MSYEGSREFLCANGHHSVFECWDDDPPVCRCGAPMTFAHSIDHTNGDVEDDPSTMPAPKEQIGSDDIWREDHYGNRYAVQDHRYRPVREWQVLKS